MKKNSKIKLEIKKRIKNISTIDILGLFAIFFITSVVYFFFSRKTEYLSVTIKLFNHDAPEYNLGSNQTKSWYIEQIKEGKAQKNMLGETLIEIADVYSYPNAYVYNDVYVTLKVKAIQNKTTKQYLYEGSPLLIHDVKSFKIHDLLVYGEIIDINSEPRQTKKFKIVFELFDKRLGSDFINNGELMIKGVNNFVADQITEGLIIKDSRNNELVRINKVEKKPGIRVVATENGTVNIQDPERTQVIIHADLVAEKINGFYFYRKEETLLIDERIWLTFEKITVPGTIISIDE